MPRNAPKAVLEASRFPGPQKVSAPDAFFEPFGDTCAILAAILRPAGRQRGPQIEHCGIKSHSIFQNSFQKEVSENAYVLISILMRKTWDLECAEAIEML